MNSGCIESFVGLDRLATPDEVRRAMSSSSPRALEFLGLRDDFSEMDFNASGRAPNLREAIEWLMIAREMQDFICNCMHSEEAIENYVRQELEYSERMRPCSNKRPVTSPAGNATLRMSRKPNYASIRGCLIADGALRKRRKRRQVWRNLKILKFKLHYVASSSHRRIVVCLAIKKTGKLKSHPIRYSSPA